MEQLQTASKPITTKKHAFEGSERRNGIPPPSLQNYDQDRTHTFESDKNSYSVAFAKRQAKQGGLLRREKTPPKVMEAEPGISLEGRGLDKEKETQPKKKARKTDTHKGNLHPPPKLRSGPLNYETGVERRPSIERGGTNTIEMEVSGVGSRGSSRGKENWAAPEQQVISSQAESTKEEITGGSRKREKHSPAVEDTDSGVQPIQYVSRKPPVPPTSMDRATNPSLSAPIKNAQKKARKSRHYSHQSNSQESGYSTAGDDTPTRRSSTATAEMESSSSTGGSPSESQLIELQPFSNPEQGLRDSMAKISNEDWNVKCNGMIGIRQVAMYHPAVLQAQLHSVVLAVQKEVGTSI